MRALLYFSDRIKQRKEIEKLVAESGMKLVRTKPDVVLVFGGDGTLLKSEQNYPNIPKILISTIPGSLGYLAAGSIRNLAVILEKILWKKYEILERMKIDIDYIGKKGSVLNEVLITSSQRGRSIKIELLRNNKPVFILNCDGIIVFTPTGSTAYSMSCGGPILKTDGIGVTLIHPHLSPTNYFVFNEKDDLTIRLRAGKAVVILDGGNSLKLKGDIKIKKAKDKAQLIFMNEKGIPEVYPPRVIL